ncbi:MAG: hypothetical protein CVT90_02625, partial [Candidatus Altiarchaeales archaeon HGW-Altiarchaeales-3]
MQKNKTKTKKDITKTTAWRRANSDYGVMVANDNTSLLGEPAEGQKRINILKPIIGNCPEYCPALFDIGQECIAIGKDKESEKYLDRAFNVMENYHFTKKYTIKMYKNICSFLKSKFRYELSAKYYENL